VIRLVVVLALAGACTDDGGPRLDAVSPASASRGAMVTLTGTRFCGPAGCAQAAGQIQIGLDQPVRAQVVSFGPSAATIIVPQATPTGDTELVLEVAGRSSNALAFQVLP
jgi:hypothetical protein